MSTTNTVNNATTINREVLSLMKRDELRSLCKKEGLHGYSNLKKAELIDLLLSNVEKPSASVDETVKAELGVDYRRARVWFKALRPYVSLKTDDGLKEMAEAWTLVQSATKFYTDNNSVKADTIEKTYKVFARMFHGRVEKKDEPSHEDKVSFINACLDSFRLDTVPEINHKEVHTLIKIPFGLVQFDSNGKAYVNSKDITTRVLTAESGISRILDDMGKDSFVLGVDTNRDGCDKYPIDPASDEPDALANSVRENIFKYGITDVATGKHYMMSAPSASQTRQSFVPFVENDTVEDVHNMWAKFVGASSFDKMLTSVGKEKDGKVFVNFSKFLARVSQGGANSFDIFKMLKAKDTGLYKRLINADIHYVRDIEEKVTLHNGYQWIAKGQLEKFNEKTVELTPGDGQGIWGYDVAIPAFVGYGKLTRNEGVNALHLLDKFGFDSAMKFAEFRRVVKKIPSTTQIRVETWKGTLAISKYVEGIVVPNSMRKFVAGGWGSTPFCICNVAEKKNGFVNMNQQFINSLRFLNPNALVPIAEHWHKSAMETLHDVDKAMVFHGLASSMGEDNNEDNALKISIAIRHCQSLATDPYIMEQRKRQYAKLYSNMKVGRIMVPGAYTYMMCDPNFLLNRMFGMNLPELQSGEYYFEGMECESALFRSPLIAPFEAQKVRLVSNEEYQNYHNVVIFNGYDGIWDLMGGADFDGDECAIVPANNELGEIIVSGVQTDSPAVYADAQNAQSTAYSWEALCQYKATHSSLDQTGMITNLGTCAIEIANHYDGVIKFAKKMGLSDNAKVYLWSGVEQDKARAQRHGHPVVSTFDKNNDVIRTNGLWIRTWNSSEKKNEYEELVNGWKTIEELRALADGKEVENLLVRVLQGANIDSAKTGYDAVGGMLTDGMKQNTMKSSNMACVQFVKRTGRAEALDLDLAEFNDKALKRADYISLSPLGRLYDYVTLKEAEFWNEFNFQGSSKLPLLTSVMSKAEKEAFSKLVSVGDQSFTLENYIKNRKTAYNRKVAELFSSDNYSDKDKQDLMMELKEEETTILADTAKALNVPLEVIAEVAYKVVYDKNSQQNKGLSYGWLLFDSLVSVFSRASEGATLYRLPQNAEEVVIVNGEFKVNGIKYADINAVDQTPLIEVVNNRKYALVVDTTEKRNTVVEPTKKNFKVKFVGGFTHYGIDKETFKNLLRKNGYKLTVVMENGNLLATVNGATVAFINAGGDIHASEMNGHTVRFTRIRNDDYEETAGSFKNVTLIVIE